MTRENRDFYRFMSLWFLILTGMNTDLFRGVFVGCALVCYVTQWVMSSKLQKELE